MNCRTFHRNLEDYLEDGLDFPGRFGMERHAQQCIGCGKVIADAQHLGRLARELERVKAPSNFEDSLLAEIGKRKMNRRFSRFRRLWIYGVEPLSWRKLAMASSGFAVLLLGVLYAYNYASFHSGNRPSPPLQTSIPQASPHTQAAENSEIVAKGSFEKSPENKAAQSKAIEKTAPASQPIEIAKEDEERIADQEEADYIEYLTMGPDNRPVTVRMPLPKEIRMQYSQPSEEYFIRNVSH
jgi:hypothetical protein